MAHRLRTLGIAFGVIVAGTLFVAFLSYAASWTAPAGPPPGNNVDAPVNVGSNTQTKVGDLLVDGFSSTAMLVDGPALFLQGLDANSQNVTGVAAPVADSDAVNKGYLSAQVSGAKADSVTLYGTGSSQAPGGNAPACPSTYPYQVAAGFGPHWIGVYQSSAAVLIDAGLPAPGNNTVIAAFASDSVCSASRVTAVNVTTTGMPAGWNSLTPRGADACAQSYDVFGNALPGQFSCNSCRVCSSIAP